MPLSEFSLNFTLICRGETLRLELISRDLDSSDPRAGECDPQDT